MKKGDLVFFSRRVNGSVLPNNFSGKIYGEITSTGFDVEFKNGTIAFIWYKDKVPNIVSNNYFFISKP